MTLLEVTAKMKREAERFRSQGNEDGAFHIDQVRSAFEADPDLTLRERIQTALGTLQRDPHDWSARPCATCAGVSVAVGFPFGCDKFRQSSKGGA